MKVSEFKAWKKSGIASFDEFKNRQASTPTTAPIPAAVPHTLSPEVQRMVREAEAQHRARASLTPEAQRAVDEVIADARAWQSLNASEAAMCRSFNIDPRDFLARKEAMIESGGLRDRSHVRSAEMTEEDRALCRKLGLDESAFAAHKAKLSDRWK